MITLRHPDATLTKIMPKVAPKPGVVYVPSQYVISIEHKGKNYLWQNMTKHLIEGSLPERACAGEGFDELICAHFLVPEGKDECAYYNSISKILRIMNKKPGIGTYTILPTFGCNARCVYCYEEGVKPVTMTDEIVEQTIRYILDTRGPKVKLAWFGGEPLVGEKTIDRICAALRDEGVEYKSSMVSNGSLITPEIVRKMVEDWKLGQVQISMDGAREDYIARKAYSAYDGYYEKVIESIRLMAEAGINVNIRCNVDEENWPRIQEFVKDMSKAIVDEPGAGKVKLYFCPLNNVRMSDGDLEMWTKICDARSMIYDAGLDAYDNQGLNMRMRANHCMADAGSVVITPDGKIYMCEHCPASSLIGDIWNGITNDANRKAFACVDETREKCKKCPYLPDCTSFRTCPVEDRHCRAVHDVQVRTALDRVIDRKLEQSSDDGDEEEKVEC